MGQSCSGKAPQRARAADPTPRPAQVTSQSPQAPPARVPGPGRVRPPPAPSLIPAPSSRRDRRYHTRAGRRLGPPTAALTGGEKEPESGRSTSPPTALRSRRYLGKVGAAGPEPIGPPRPSARPLDTLIGRSCGAGRIGGGGGAPPTHRPSRGQRGSGRLLVPRPSGSLCGAWVFPAPPGLSRFAPAPAPARWRRVGAAAGGARLEGRPLHCPGGCSSLARRWPGTPQGRLEAGKGGGRRPAGRGDGPAKGLRA